ncbi:putative phosphohistidine phosphatase, SixA [Thioalkalivibrio sp. K90mix]|uniref:SixA phosphatase family protein n=1 Tax=Thioalkalivibrio sp. (strain K90mix) TaxID=396595 RepID=UPI000195A9B2|nr:histidine phosphatase family protein [Thioalkalivibrio sp. K90mix]ADC71457.1 putative phosphohistidine phosphatase, SixA [Thioalkalivibrio sp. K90mix]
MSLRPRLVLVRHAQAGNAGDWEGDDRDRPLSEAGQVSARRMAGSLATLLAGHTELLTSPYLRARQTAAPLADALAVPVRQKKWLAPGQVAGVELEALAARLPADGSLVVVGHEPDLSSLAGRLMGGRPGAGGVHMGKGSVCALGGGLPGPMQLVWLLPRRVLEDLSGERG